MLLIFELFVYIYRCSIIIMIFVSSSWFLLSKWEREHGIEKKSDWHAILLIIAVIDEYYHYWKYYLISRSHAFRIHQIFKELRENEHERIWRICLRMEQMVYHTHTHIDWQKCAWSLAILFISQSFYYYTNKAMKKNADGPLLSNKYEMKIFQEKS